MSDAVATQTATAVSATDDAVKQEKKQKQKKSNVKPQDAEKRKPASTRCGCANQQKQRGKEFAEHKASILANLGSNACDFSPKGSVDVKCHAIMDVLNIHEDFITTSSCSGRIALFHSVQGGSNDNNNDNDDHSAAKMKRGGAEALGWLVVKHGVLLPREMLLVVRYLCGEAATAADEALDEEKMACWQSRVAGHEADEAYQGELEGTLFLGQEDPMVAAAQGPPRTGTVALKMEPFVMHVECRTMESAKELLSAAVSDSGYRNSGVVPPGKKIMCGIRSAAGLGMEVPLVLNGVNHVAQDGQRAYVWALVGLANEKMQANEQKTKLLARSVAKRVAAMDEKKKQNNENRV